MKPVFHIDLTRSVEPVLGKSRTGTHGDLGSPEGVIDRKRGLTFPIVSGGFTFASEGIIDDAAGTLEIVFAHRTSSPKGALVQAWELVSGAPLLAIEQKKLSLNVYGRRVEMRVNWKKSVEYKLSFSWDHRLGVSLSVKPRNGRAQTIRRRLVWKAFLQKRVPFSIGGVDAEPRYRNWGRTFRGWIRSVKVGNRKFLFRKP